MRRCGTLVAVGLALSGCKYLDRAKHGDRPPGDDRGLTPTSGRKNRDAPPPAALPKPDQHWLDDPSGKPGRTDLPPQTPTGRRTGGPARPGPVETGPSVGAAGQGILAGYAVDEYGKKLSRALIDVSPAERTGPGAPTSVETDDDGSFQIDGLQPGRTYILSARTSREGVKVAGQVYAKPPDARLRLTLREGISLPEDGPRNPAGATRPPKPGLPAPVPLNTEGGPALPPTDTGRSDGSWSPAGPPVPALPPRVDPTPAPAQGRPELTTDGPPPDFRPTTTTIPPPPTSIPTPVPAPGRTLPPFPPGPDRRESRSVRPKSEFVLVDTLGRAKEFPSGRAGDLVLVEFLTTECVYCTKAVPALKAVQAKYGARGLDVIGVVCDEVDTPQRRAVAANYQRANDLNYLLYVEPGKRPGTVRDRLGAAAYPTMVLLAGNGDVLWKGDPSAFDQLERVIDEQLGK